METCQATINFQERAISEVLHCEVGGGVDIKHHFKIDLLTYSWAPLYVRDQAIRENIEKLGSEIVEVENSLIDKASVKRCFIQKKSEARKEFLDLIGSSLCEVQGRRDDFENLMEALGNRILKILPITSLSDEETESIFRDLKDGITQKDIDRQVLDLNSKVKKLEEEIVKLSPQDRWIYSPSGEPFAYPEGCRWTTFERCWDRVAESFEGRVNINGKLIETESEKRAWKLLKMGEVPKRPPLRSPIEN